MKIWFVKIGEPLPTEKNSRLLRTGLFATYLSKKGHDITWFSETFSHAKKKHLYDSDQELMVDHLKLILLKVPGYKKNLSLKRFHHHDVFAKRFFEKAELINEKPDLIICSIPTIENGFSVYKFAKKYNIKYSLDMRDSWPDDIVSVAPKFLKPFVKLVLFNMYRKMNVICRHADFIMGCSNSLINYAMGFSNRDRSEKDYLMLHGYPELLISEDNINDGINYWESLGVKKDLFTICFFGTLSKFRNFLPVIQSMKKYSDKYEIQLVVCGDGDLLDYYKSLATGLKHVYFPGWVDSIKISALMKISNIGVAPYAKGWRNDFPNKYFEYFSGKLAVLSSVYGEISTFLAEKNIGYTYDPDSESEFSNYLLKMLNDTKKTEQMGDCAYEQFNLNFCQDILFNKGEKFLINFLGS